MGYCTKHKNFHSGLCSFCYEEKKEILIKNERNKNYNNKNVEKGKKSSSLPPINTNVLSKNSNKISIKDSMQIQPEGKLFLPKDYSFVVKSVFQTDWLFRLFNNSLKLSNYYSDKFSMANWLGKNKKKSELRSQLELYKNEILKKRLEETHKSACKIYDNIINRTKKENFNKWLEKAKSIKNIEEKEIRLKSKLKVMASILRQKQEDSLKEILKTIKEKRKCFIEFEKDFHGALNLYGTDYIRNGNLIYLLNKEKNIAIHCIRGNIQNELYAKISSESNKKIDAAVFFTILDYAESTNRKINTYSDFICLRSEYYSDDMLRYFANQINGDKLSTAEFSEDVEHYRKEFFKKFGKYPFSKNNPSNK